MYDREAFENVASEIAVWESAALRLPLPELRAMLADWQHDLAESLNAFNGIYLNHDDHDEPDRRFRALHRCGHPARYRRGDLHPGHHPAPAPGGAAELTTSAGPGGRPSPGPASHNSFPYPLKQRRASACPTLPAACPHA